MLYNIISIYDNPVKLDPLRAEWDKYGGCLTNVLSAQQAVNSLNDKEYHIIGISADYVKEQLQPSVKMIRDATNTPLIVIADQYNSVDMVASLRNGADGYMSTPDTMEELVMLGFAFIRRYCSFDCARHAHDPLDYQGIHLDQRFRVVSAGGKDVPLTSSEFDCLRTLMLHPGMTFSYEHLYDSSFGVKAKDGFIENSIHSMISRIRQKLGSEHAKYIISDYGCGYKIE
jgi:DNA-binding response OmpR family regulator